MSMMTEERYNWLQENGYYPITDDIIQEAADRAAKGDLSSAKLIKESMMTQGFKYYKRYGDTIMPYSEGYLAGLTFEEIRNKDLINRERFNAW